MLRKTFFLTFAATLVVLTTSSNSRAWYAYHYRYGGYGGSRSYGYHYGAYRGYGGGGYHYGYVRRY
jgi:hypothetical protein